MRTHVQFRSNVFPAYEGESDKINPGIWGKRLAEFLQRKLGERNIATGDIYFEDWGVALPIENDLFPIWVGCGNDESNNDGYRCFIEPSKPKIRRFFRAIDTTAVVTKIGDALDEALRSTPDIREIHWSATNEYES